MSEFFYMEINWIYMNKKIFSYSLLFWCLTGTFPCRSQEKIFPGADEDTPSRAQYFTWINNTNEGATESQTLINLDFFGWLHKEYGMILDIYAFDAGMVDGKGFYGKIDSERFRKQFPNGIAPIYEKARNINTRLGLWGGPDGFGNTVKEAEERKAQMVSLCKDYNWALFKFDAVCGPLRPEKEDHFIDMMKQCRSYSPDLILLNHRLGLKKSLPYATTFLWEGMETYIDVHCPNTVTAPHNRAGAMRRGLVPGMQRLTEDCGVCLSSCLDNWDDELILQAFNRSLILAPEIYGNPWLLADDEFPKLARIYNLHRRWGELLVKGMELPEKYGPYGVSRGNGKSRIITLRNLDWHEKTCNIVLDGEIGLTKSSGKIEVRIYHPYEKIVGHFKYGEEVQVKIPAFRSMMLTAQSSGEISETGVEGVAFEVIKDMESAPKQINLLGMPGEKAVIRLAQGTGAKQVFIDGKEVKALAKGGKVEIEFDGEPLKHPYHRYLGKAEKRDIRDDAATLFEATVYAADNNALEVRSLERSGESAIKEVTAARNAFFQQDAFVGRGCWDRFAFDGNMETGFWPVRRSAVTAQNPCFRIDLGEKIKVDSIVIRVNNLYELRPLLTDEGNTAYFSTDLKEWEEVVYINGLDSRIPIGKETRYIKIPHISDRVSEIDVYSGGRKLPADRFRANNLFSDSRRKTCVAMWQKDIVLDELADHSYLSIALDGVHGKEGAYAALVVDGEYIGAPERAISYLSNTWEYPNKTGAENYTYYIPMKKEYVGKKMEIIIMGYDKEHLDFTPNIWMCAYPIPFKKQCMIIK